jgi:His/Glu/Gln/Arg/opine family amino acid ABC transporter permease subunit
MLELLAVYKDNIQEWLPQMLSASLGTLKLTVTSFSVAAVLGLAISLARLSKLPAVQALAIAYIEVIRGLPALVILYIVYFVPPQIGATWLIMSSFLAATIGLGLHGGAILAEVFRSGIEALHTGQKEAALSLGMTPLKALTYIILPQAIRIVLPPVGNYAIGLLKDTAVCALIAAPELMLRAKDLASSSFQPMAVFVLAGVFYFAMSYPLSLLVRSMERRLSIHESAGEYRR